MRPFISGHVANSMAAEVIALLHSLLTAPETHAAQTWATAVEKVRHSWLICHNETTIDNIRKNFTCRDSVCLGLMKKNIRRENDYQVLAITILSDQSYQDLQVIQSIQYLEAK